MGVRRVVRHLVVMLTALTRGAQTGGVPGLARTGILAVRGHDVEVLLAATALTVRQRVVADGAVLRNHEHVLGSARAKCGHNTAFAVVAPQRVVATSGVASDGRARVF